MRADTDTLSADAPARTDPDSDSDSETGDESVPAYRDPDRLREVYGAYDSFTAMTDALAVDVTAQTVRRNMIEHGIHSPETADDGDTDTDTDAESDTDSGDDSATGGDADPAFDDTHLPDGVTPADVRDAVAESSSLHGAQTALGLDIAETRALLQDLGVLEYVTGRLSDRREEPDTAEIEGRIYDSLTAHADGGGVDR